MSPSGVYATNNGGRYFYALRYKRGTDLARRFPGVANGRFASREEAEGLRRHCPNAEHMEVVDVREVGT